MQGGVVNNMGAEPYAGVRKNIGVAFADVCRARFWAW